MYYLKDSLGHVFKPILGIVSTHEPLLAGRSSLAKLISVLLQCFKMQGAVVVENGRIDNGHHLKIEYVISIWTETRTSS